MPECEDCGGEVESKNASVHYREFCMECIEGRAYKPDERTSLEEIVDD